MASDIIKSLRYRWLIFSLLSLSYILVYFHRLCPAILAVDIMRDLNTSGSLTGLLGAAYFYPYALMQLPAGLLSDSWGARKTITLFFIIAFAGSLILGMSQSVFTAIFGRTLVGIGVAMLFVPTMKILAEWFHAREFAFMTGILMAMGGLGSFIAASPLVWLNALIGWRNSFTVVGIFTLILAILIGIFVRNRPSDLNLPSPSGLVKNKEPAISLSLGMKKVLWCRHFWPLAIWFFFNCGIFFSFAGLWAGPYMMQVYHMTKSESGNILSMIAIGMVIGSPVLSFLSDKIFKGRKSIMLLSGMAMIVITGILFFYTDGISKSGMYLLCFFLSVFSSAIVVIGFTMNKELFPVQMAGTSTGLINLFPFAGGAVFQPLLGYILERFGKAEG
ncbi:MAG: MFS transporter, partial [Desulfobacterales bacterium]|nr:MFS transporter [Desulfobacterales bacterium]